MEESTRSRSPPVTVASQISSAIASLSRDVAERLLPEQIARHVAVQPRDLYSLVRLFWWENRLIRVSAQERPARWRVDVIGVLRDSSLTMLAKAHSLVETREESLSQVAFAAPFLFCVGPYDATSVAVWSLETNGWQLVRRCSSAIEAVCAVRRADRNRSIRVAVKTRDRVRLFSFESGRNQEGKIESKMKRLASLRAGRGPIALSPLYLAVAVPTPETTATATETTTAETTTETATMADVASAAFNLTMHGVDQLRAAFLSDQDESLEPIELTEPIESSTQAGCGIALFHTDCARGADLPACVVAAHKAPVGALDFSADGTCLLSASRHGQHVAVWRLTLESSHVPSESRGSPGSQPPSRESRVHLRKERRLFRGVTQAAFAALRAVDLVDEREVAFVSHRGTLHLWRYGIGNTDLADVEEKRVCIAHDFDSNPSALDLRGSARTGWVFAAHDTVLVYDTTLRELQRCVFDFDAVSSDMREYTKRTRRRVSQLVRGTRAEADAAPFRSPQFDFCRRVLPHFTSTDTSQDSATPLLLEFESNSLSYSSPEVSPTPCVHVERISPSPLDLADAEALSESPRSSLSPRGTLAENNTTNQSDSGTTTEHSSSHWHSNSNDHFFDKPVHDEPIALTDSESEHSDSNEVVDFS
ncbi:MAG: hypothetical protein MHM6MM_002855 [Cercozoa sp. M6MM]